MIAAGRSAAASFALMLGVACRPAGSSSARVQIDSAGLAALVDSAFAAGMARERIPGAAFVLVQNGRVVLARGFGKADVASGRLVRTDQPSSPSLRSARCSRQPR